MSTAPKITLTRVNKFNRNAKPKPGHPLSCDEVEAIRVAFTGAALPARPGTVAYALLDTLIKQDQWLLCGCCGAVQNPPVMFAMRTLSSDHPLTLVRNHSRALHVADCPFYRDPQTTHGHSLAPRSGVVALGVLKILSDAQAARSPKGQGIDVGKPADASTPPLARVLFTLLESSGCNRITARSRSVSMDANRVKQAAAGLFMDGAKKVPAKPFIGGNFHAFKTVFEEATRAASKGAWPKDLEPHGFVIGLCSLTSCGEEMFLTSVFGVDRKFAQWKVTGRVRLPGQGTVAPYLGIGLVARLAGKKEPSIVQAYVHPANSLDDWTLVDSDLERQTLAILTSRLDAMVAMEHPYSIVKPYIDRKSKQSGTPYRPDFCLLSRGRTAFIETMGYVDQTYLTRKAAMHEVMKEDHPVFEHRPGQNDAALQSFLDRFVGFQER